MDKCENCRKDAGKGKTKFDDRIFCGYTCLEAFIIANKLCPRCAMPLGLMCVDFIGIKYCSEKCMREDLGCLKNKAGLSN